MAEQDTKPNEEVTTPPAGNTQTEATTTQQEPVQEVNEVEERARAQGWVPKEEWTGDPASWRPADVYIDRGELLGKIKSQSSEMRELKAMMAYVAEQNRKLYEAGYSKAIADLEAQRDQAIVEGDTKAIRKLDADIRAHEKALEETQRATVQVENTQAAVQAAAERFNRFKSANPWYVEDEVMRDWANGRAVTYKGDNPRATDEEIYEHLSQIAREKFPQKFQRKVAAPSPDGGGKSRGTGSPAQKGESAEFDSFVAQLPEAEAQIARNLVKRGYITKEKYIQDLKAVGGLR